MAPLSPERWRTVSPLVDEALDLSGEQRAAWLASIREQDAALAADLRALLAEHAAVHDSGFLERSVPLPARTALTLSLAGQKLGAYRLISRIGQGGMGSVWLAERCDGRFEGRAAIKLLNIALVGRAGEERFRREGTILATLTHPNIAHLADAGVSPTGQPYLVLEHVNGQTIDRYCHEHSLGIDARLHLFLGVLEAVAHAHANLIVHRDIKPANVLRTPPRARRGDDCRGRAARRRFDRTVYDAARDRARPRAARSREGGEGQRAADQPAERRRSVCGPRHPRRTDGARPARRRRRARPERARRTARTAGRDPDGDGAGLSPPRRLRQGPAPARTGPPDRTSELRARAQEPGAEPSRPRNRARRSRRLCRRRPEPGAGARDAADAARPGAPGRGGHPDRAVARLPGSGVQLARRAAAA